MSGEIMLVNNLLTKFPRVLPHQEKKVTVLNWWHGYMNQWTRNGSNSLQPLHDVSINMADFSFNQDNMWGLSLFSRWCSLLRSSCLGLISDLQTNHHIPLFMWRGVMWWFIITASDAIGHQFIVPGIPEQDKTRQRLMLFFQIYFLHYNQFIQSQIHKN